MLHKCKVAAFPCKFIKQLISPHLEGQISNAFSININETKIKHKLCNAWSIIETYPLQFDEKGQNH